MGREVERAERVPPLGVRGHTGGGCMLLSHVESLAHQLSGLQLSGSVWSRHAGRELLTPGLWQPVGRDRET
eukprot:scaffold876_cov99-Isochrysis_galbana.AAC.2